jgi:hypothetical protein
MKNVIYFDLETQRSADDVGGWNNKKDMGLSVGVTFSTADGQYRIYAERHVQDLVKTLLRADLVIGFNILNFDYEVLQGYTPLDMRQVPTLDLMADIAQKIGHRISLDAAAQATLGTEKIADGMDAIRWYREGRLMEIAEYCCYDVKITRLLHEYGQEHHQILYANKFGRKLSVKVEW